ncbi:hypothetical protein IE53DRAFT_362372 [Violaceomyces palustris]|uniref:Uncharacterized protein n=1 Tax=Violaceomyces palustris TaxID=1673888 RepID=A0ACD0NX59_9BASI|nr:hypothetical protein IE53DRAFT_362372 [Violaceomyces palustris]
MALSPNGQTVTTPKKTRENGRDLISPASTSTTSSSSNLGTPFSDRSNVSDVETTNWNAVKMLASKYGITLRSCEDLQGSVGVGSGSQMVLGRGGGDASTGEKLGQSEDEPEDLGVGTPFTITATRLEGGRIIYRFKWRGGAMSEATKAANSPGNDGEQRKTQRAGPMNTRQDESSTETSPGLGASKAQQGGNIFRKSSAGLMLKGSRSIPALKTKSSNLFHRNPSAEGTKGIDRNHSSADAEPQPERGSGARVVESDATARDTFLGSPSGSMMMGGAKPSTLSSVAMTRAESSPVKGAHANRSGRLQGGDVLGALLGLRYEEMYASPAAKQGSGAAQMFQSADSVETLNSAKGKGKQRMASVDSGASSHTLESISSSSGVVGLNGGDFRHPERDRPSDSRDISPFGQEILIHTTAFRKDSKVLEASIKNDQIPTVVLAEVVKDEEPPLLPDFDFASDHIKPPRLRQLREAQSFESTGSSATLKAAEEGVDEAMGNTLISRYPPAILPHLHRRSGSGQDDAFIFDVLQHYSLTGENTDQPSSFPPVSNLATTSQAHGRSNSGDFIGTSLSPSASGIDLFEDVNKHSSAQAQSTTVSAAPGDDPRFALWAVRKGGALVVSGRDGSADARHSLKLDSNFKSAYGNASSSAADASTGIIGSSKHKNVKAAGGSSSYDVSRLSTGLRSKEERVPPPTRTISAGAPDGKRDLFASGKAILLAATATRLVAELTSEIDNRLLTDFFYTYRAYLEPIELLRLLTLRFEWALAEPASAHDEARRRIVRVRTYVVIKFWLQHHFEFDFLPSRELRKGLTNWLNRLANDPRLPSRPADFSIVKSLRKIVRGLKERYSQGGVGGLLIGEGGKILRGEFDGGEKPWGTSGGSGTQSRRESASEYKDSAGDAQSPQVGEDVDLEFGPGSPRDDAIVEAATIAAKRHSVHDELTRISELGPPLEPLGIGSNRILTPRQMAAPFSPSSHTLSIQAPPPPLPHSHSAISRVFVNTVGRLSRFKRVLGSRGTMMPNPFPGSNEQHAEGLEFEANDSGDLLFIRGGLESFINHFNLDTRDGGARSGRTAAEAGLPEEDEEGSEGEEAANETDPDDPNYQVSDSTGQEETPSLTATSAKTRSTPASSIDLARSSALVFDDDEDKPEAGLGIAGLSMDRSADSGEYGPSAEPVFDGMTLNLDVLSSSAQVKADRYPARTKEPLHHYTSDQTLRSICTLERPTKRGSPPHTASRESAGRSFLRMSTGSIQSIRPNIVQLDDIDLSSDEDDGAVRRALRRLPGARDLRMANNIRDLEALPRKSLDSLSNASLGMAYGRAAKYSSMSGTSLYGRPLSIDDSALQVPSRPVIGLLQSDLLDPDEALKGYQIVEGFELPDEAFESDEEPGDAEAALRRLEGFIDEEKQKEKAKKAETWYLNSMVRRKEKNSAVAGSSGEPGDSVEGVQASASILRRSTTSTLNDGAFADHEDDHEDESDLPSSDARMSQSLAPDGRLEREGGLEEAAAVGIEGSGRRRSSSIMSARSNFDAQRSPPPSSIPRSTIESVKVKTPPTVPAPASTSASTPGGNQPSKQARRPISFKPQASAQGGRFGRAPPSGNWAQIQAVHQARALDRSSKLDMWNLPPVHRSFLHAFKSEVIAHQLTLIEAELFKSLSWDELAGSRWKERKSKVQVLDWESFYQSRVREKLECQSKGLMYRERAVEAIVARFNLTCNWVASEIVLTQNLDERAALIGKFIRIAFKCYRQSNFASMTQIVFGLQSPWVERLRKTWSKIGLWELRVLKDLKAFTNPSKGFNTLRNAMQKMVADNGLEDLTSSNSTNRLPTASASAATAGGVARQQGGNMNRASPQYKGGRLSNKPEIRISDGAVPFFGLFLGDLSMNDTLPSYLDPSSPNTRLSPSSSQNEASKPRKLARLADPKAFDHLPPLPQGVELEALVNVYKYRVVATTIKTILAFQERTKAYSLEADANAFVKCLKIRCLMGEQLTQISHIAEP